MKKPEARLTRGTGNYLHCTDYEEAIQAMKEYGQDIVLEFLSWYQPYATLGTFSECKLSYIVEEFFKHKNQAE